jgi:hypothetical protein
MKSTKAEAPKKGSKKAVKKEIQKNLTDKFFEAVRSLGHDAETIGEDLILVSKFVAKKIAKKVGNAKKGAAKKTTEAVAEVAGAGEKVVEKLNAKGTKKAEKSTSKGASKAKRMVNSVQVTGLASEEKLAQVLSKPKLTGDTKQTKSGKAKVLKPSAPKLSSKKSGTTE